ncbi:MAG: ABC transporter permease [Vicinamibacterales bacterium]
MAEWLLARHIRPDEGAMVRGDLCEAFRRRVDGTGRGRARAWYWIESARLTWGFWRWTPRPRWQRGTVMAMDDLRYAVRRLGRQPLATMVSIATLACAIGAAAATWSLISAVLLHPLPVRAPDRLVELDLRYETSRGTNTLDVHLYPLYPALRDAGVIDLAGWGSVGALVPIATQPGDGARDARVTFISHDLLGVLGLQPSLGRSFAAAEDQRGVPLVALLSDRFWRAEFGGDRGVVGRVMRVRDRDIVIVGVLPREFRGLSLTAPPDLYLPLHAIDQVQPVGNYFASGVAAGFSPSAWVHLVARLPDGVSAAQMTDRLNGLALDAARGGTFQLADLATTAIPEASRAGVEAFSRLLGLTVALLLAIGSVTVGLLLLVRTESRAGEFAMCLALGATRLRLAAGVAIEGVLLAAAGAVLALPVSQVLFDGLRAFDLPGGISLDRLDLAIDGRVVAAAMTAAVASVVLMAVVAGVFGLRRGLSDALRSQTAATPRVTRRRSRTALVAAQVAVTLVLVSGAGLFARSLGRALALNEALHSDRLLMGAIYLDANGYDATRAQVFFDALRARLAPNPAVAALGYSYSLGSMSGGYPIQLDGQPRELPSAMAFVGIDDRYLRTMGLPVSAGRDFTPDDRAGAPLVAIVSASLARVVAGDGDPIGHRIAEIFSRPGEPPDTIEIVGVVPDVITRVNRLEPLALYRPIAQQRPSPRRVVTFRAAGDVGAAAAAVTEAVRGIDPAVRPSPMTTLDSQLLDQMGPQRFGMAVMGALGAIALLLSVLGAWVLAETMAALRRREMGIRAALGATGGHLRTLLLADTFRLVGLGLALGFGLSWLGAGTIRAFLFQVEPFDPVVTGTVSVLIVVLAVLVSLRPAFAAARVDLATVLRED